MRAVLLLAVLFVGACTAPPPSAYTNRNSGPPQGVAIGRDASNEACVQQGRGDGGTVDVFCGTWQQPSATIARVGPGGPHATPGVHARNAAVRTSARHRWEERFATVARASGCSGCEGSSMSSLFYCSGTPGRSLSTSRCRPCQQVSARVIPKAPCPQTLSAPIASTTSGQRIQRDAAAPRPAARHPART